MPAHIRHRRHVVARAAMAPAPAVQRETISAALTLLVVVASAAISLLRVLLSVRRLTLLPAAGDEGRKAVDVAVVLGWATLLRLRLPPLLLLTWRIELRVARQIRLRVAGTIGRLLLLVIAELRRALVIPLIEGVVAAAHVRAATFRP